MECIVSPMTASLRLGVDVPKMVGLMLLSQVVTPS